ncbi:uncharacterized protein [Choristoneura fumiferana]|uniref:uncharacterized protein n=1 Tax=Choristoneura fumiferana TaxID=7141 RepID=UPI003D15A8EB
MLLLLLYLLPTAASEATTAAPTTFVKPLEICPDVGYFFERELTNGVETGACYLCFCKGRDHAICSLRANERCDGQYYSHMKREARLRRSAGYSRSSGKTKKQLALKGECKPLKSSKSIGCPPDDWCVGCTVCDCSVDGHWNCHVMSFCPTQKSTKITGKKSRKSSPAEPNSSSQSQKQLQSVVVTPVTKKTFPLRKDEKNSFLNDSDEYGRKMVKKSIAHAPVQPMISVETKRQFQKITTKDVPIIIKRYISTHSPIKSPELLKYKNDTKKFAQMLYKHYKSNVNNPPNEMKKWSSKALGDKFVNKRSLMKKKIKVTSLKARKPMNLKEHKDKSKTMNKKNKNKNHDMIKKKKINYNSKKYKGKMYDNKRHKRDISSTTTETMMETNVESVDTANTTASTNKNFEATEISFTNSEDMASNLSNYAYTVDNHATLSIPAVKTINNDTDYATTEQNVIVVTMDNMILTTTENHSVNKLQIEKENDKKEDNTFKRNIDEINFERTAGVNNTVKVLESTKVKTVDLNFIMDKPKISHYQNETENIVDDKKIINGQDIRKLFTRRRKVSLTKLVKTLNARSKKYYPKNNNSSDAKSTSIRINGTLNDIQTVLEKLVHGYMRNHTQDKLKKKSNTAVKYLKKLFSKLFSINNNKTDDKIAVMDSICENFGPCKISVKKLGILNYKVNQLISETHKALSSIKIIKGLLQLVNVKNETIGNATSEEPDFKTHVKKLNAILKDSYAPDDQLTQTQATQIYYIKSNTQVFIKSIGKFANILNDIINIIKSENTKTKRTVHNYKLIKNKHTGIQERGIVGKIKNLLLRYNLLQNTFLRKMYEALTTLEMQNQNTKMYNYRKYRTSSDKVYKMEIEKYVDNINFNLRKLRDLAARVGSKERRKREAMGDDEAIEYLLTVMEYLLKRNNSLEAPPDNDGIDLLIEAIKSAPDIKPIKKKVLQYVPVKIVGPTNSVESREDNVSKPKKVRKPATEFATTTKKEDAVVDEIDVVRDDVRKTMDSYTTPADFSTKRDIVIADLSDVITEYPSKVYMATYDNFENTEKPFFEKVVSDVKAIGEPIKGIKKEESPKEDDSDTIVLDEDNKKVIPKNPSDIFAEVQTEAQIVASTHKSRNEKGKMRHYNPTNSNHPRKGNKEPKTKLDLINEAYEEEIKEQKTLTTRRPVSMKTSRIKGETGNRDKKKMLGDVSSITKEIDDMKEKKESEDLIYRKQMDLLNSLDYGTEKSAAEESDSKDVSSPLDRLNNEAFPNYFV